MNFKIFYIVLVVVVISIIGLYAWIFFEKRRERHEPRDRSQIINYMPEYANGHNKGVLNRVIEGGGGWVAVEFFPRDVDYVKLLNEKKNIALDPEVVFVPKENLKTIQRGSWSDHVNDFEIIPIKIDDIPVGFNGAKREWLMKEVEKSQIERNNLDLFESWKENTQKVMMKTQGLGIVQDYMSLNEEANKQILKQVKGEEKKFSIPGSHETRT